MTHPTHICPLDGSALLREEKVVDGVSIHRYSCPEGDFVSRWYDTDGSVSRSVADVDDNVLNSGVLPGGPTEHEHPENAPAAHEHPLVSHDHPLPEHDHPVGQHTHPSYIHDHPYASEDHSHPSHDHPYAAETHSHPYADAGHTHPLPSHTHDYAASTHTHSDKANTSHTHPYAADSHTHPYAADSHTHPYSPTTHTHDYAASGHTHPAPDLSGYSPTSHTHPQHPDNEHDDRFVQLTDPRLTDARTPTSHTHPYAAETHTHSHDHDDRYFTEAEGDARYATAGHTHAPSGGGITDQVAVATQDTANTTVTAANVTGLAITPPSAGTYMLRVWAVVTSAATTTGVRPSLLTPGAVAAQSAYRSEVATAAATSQIANNVAGTSTAGLTTPTLMTMEALLVYSATPTGPVQVQVASEVALSEVRVKAGAVMTLRKVA
jgi:hypothetical protein